MVMMMAKTRGEEVSKPNIALTNPTGEKKTPFYFQSYYYQRPLLSLKEEEVEKEKVSGN